MRFNRVNHFLFQRAAVFSNAESPVCGMTARPPGNLGQLRRGQTPHRLAVKFHIICQRYMADIHIQPHADGVCGNQKINIAVLIQLYLGISGPRRERAHHHSCPAPLAADQFGQPIHLRGRKGNNGRAALQACGFLLARISEARETIPADELCLWQQGFQQRPHGVRTQQQCFMTAPGMQQPVCENMAAFPVCTKLNLIHNQTIHRPFQRHRLYRAAEIARIGRDDFFLARDQRDLRGAEAGDQLVIILARQKPQRKPRHAGAITQHTIHRIERLAGVGRPQNAFDGGRRKRRHEGNRKTG